MLAGMSLQGKDPSLSVKSESDDGPSMVRVRLGESIVIFGCPLASGMRMLRT